MEDKKEVTSNQLPFVSKVTKRLSLNGNELEVTNIMVQGKTLDECKKVFDEVSK